MEDSFRLVMDVGGSFIKYGVCNPEGDLIESSVGQEASLAQSSARDIGAAFARVIRKARDWGPLRSACVSTPGPFDFEKGVSLMRHKFAALYGQSLKALFDAEGLCVSFLHDATAYILGEYHEGALRGSQAPCCVMLGTGLGFACMRAGRALVDEGQTPILRLWRSPYQGGIAEDYVSARAIQARYGADASVAQIARWAREGDEKARLAFEATGRHLAAVLAPVVQALGCDRLALGGQIAKSADLLALSLPVPWQPARHLDDAALRGAAWFARLGRAACVDWTCPPLIRE